MVLALSVFVYLVSTFGFTGASGGVVYAATLYLLFALGIVAFIMVPPGVSPARRVTGVNGDIAAVSYAMIVAGEICAPFYMDMSLPVLDGWDATRQIKADPATCMIPVLGRPIRGAPGNNAGQGQPKCV